MAGKQHEDNWGGRKTHDEVVGDVVGLAPAGHDVGVVVGEEDDLVDALGLELVALSDVAGKVGGGAGRSEGAGEGDDDDLLVLELCARKSASHGSMAWRREGGGKREERLTLGGIVLDGDTADLEVGGLGLVGDVLEGDALGELLADLDRSHCDGLFVVFWCFGVLVCWCFGKEVMQMSC